MIQQVNRIPLPQKAQVQDAQPKEDTSDFEALMKKTVNKLNSKDGKQTESIKRKEEGKKGPNDGNEITSLTAMLQQTIDPQLTVVETQATGKNQLSVLQAVKVQAAASPSSAKEISPVVGEMVNKSVGVQTGGNEPGAQQNPVFAIASAVKGNSAAQQSKPMIPNSAQIPMGENAVLPAANLTETHQATQQIQIPVRMEQSAEPSKQSILGTQQPAVMQVEQGEGVPAKIVFGAKQPAGMHTEQSADFSSQSLLETQAALDTEEKTSAPVQAAAYHNQKTGHVSNLFQEGNIIIKVSDASSNVAKSAGNQVADNIAVNFKAGNPQFQMDLYPQNLGKVSVKLAMQSGVLTVEIVASNPKTQSMLMANSNEIKSMLETTVSQPVRVLEPAQDKPWYQQQQEQPNQSQQQQQQQQQHKNAHYYLNALDSDITTDDFLSVMQQLRQQAYSL